MKCIRKLFLLFALFFAFSVPLVFPQEPESQLTEQYSSIRDKLQKVKLELACLKTELQMQSDLLKSAQTESSEVKAKLTQCSQNLTAITEQYLQLSNYSEKLERELQNKLLVTTLLMIILLLIVLLKAVAIVAYIKGIKVPRIIDIIV